MKVLHAFWLPEPGDTFVQAGALRLWVEVPQRQPTGRTAAISPHPFQLPRDDWPALLDLLGIPGAPHAAIETYPVQLPSVADAPLPSPHLAKYWADDLLEAQAVLHPWALDCYRLANPIKQLSDMHFLAFHQAGEVQPGSDFLFWYWFTQGLKRLLVRDQYLPALVYRQPPTPKGKRKQPPDEVYGAWQWAPEPFDQLLAQASACMPPAGAGAGAGVGVGVGVGVGGVDGLAHGETLLRHCAEVLLDALVRQTPWPAAFTKKTDRTLLAACLAPAPTLWKAPGTGLEPYRQWQGWRARITGTAQDAACTLGFQLLEPPDGGQDAWALQFVVVPRDDPSHRLALADYWSEPAAGRARLRRQLGQDFERHLLLSLGLAARVYPRLWAGLETAEPQSVALDLDAAFGFLKEMAWVLEDAGFKVIVPVWWTPQGRRRLKIRLRSAPRKSTSRAAAGTSGLNLDNLIQYSYQLAIGDQEVSADEWRRLVEAKAPLVQFRGQWVELDRDKMQEMLAFWHQHGQEMPELRVQDLLQRTAEDDSFEVDHDDALAALLEQLHDPSRLEPIAALPGLKAELRDYQRRGVAWLHYLERLGLNGCLADDMGLGKTMQVIARLVMEREGADQPPATLLVAPTSVIGNWQKEIARFAPQLSTLIHHGPDRERDAAAFGTRAARHAMVITSYSLVRKDQKLFSAMDWHRVVLDEAQNIKNPQAEQSKAVFKLPARHRLALTGTPVENRLTDLWSIFNFVHPGYLDTQARFRKRFEIPVQRDHDPVQTATLKRLVAPFILRRVKTDKAIIADLPDKVEALQYCHLSKEQAALYEGVVREVERQLDEKEGIERQGLMLSTLMRLKQVCNHPAQFLQDGSAFTPARSHKLERLAEMLEEVMAAGDSALIFSQFTEIGAQLDHLLRHDLHYQTYYLHGGTARTKREAMIAEFQDPRTEPAVFILSLKAGGVGITLTKASHVFHFDRWWNPAVEDQASDRAFRIGQEKNVFVHKFVTLGTLEERINEMIEGKKALAGAIVGNDESWLAQLDNERFKALIRLNRDAVGD